MTSARSRSDSIAVDNNKAWLLRRTDPQKARELAERSLADWTEGPSGAPHPVDIDGYLQASRTLAALAVDSGNWAEGFHRCSDLLARPDLDARPEIHSAVLAIFGRVLCRVGEPGEALRVLNKAIVVARDCGSPGCETSALCGLGLVYSLMDDFDTAMASFDESHEVAVQCGDIYGIADSLNNRALVLDSIGRAGDGLIYAHRALEVLDGTNMHSLRAHVYETTGALYRRLGDATRASKFLRSALEMSDTGSNRIARVNALVSLGELAAARNDSDAHRLLELALAEAAEIGSFMLISLAHRALSRWFERCEDHPAALRHSRLYHENWARVFTDKANLRALVLKALYESDRADAEQELIRSRNRALQAEVARRHQVEEELRRAHAEAEEARHEALIARDQADQGYRAKSDFLADMGHDLRTPLNAILGFAQILRRRDTLAARDRKAVDAIHRSGNHLLHMVDDLLDLARVEAKTVEIRPEHVRLRPFLAGVTDVIEVQAASRGVGLRVTIDADIPAALWIDPHRGTQVLLNILENAVKFSEPGGHVDVIASGLLDEAGSDSGLRVAVVDTGPGIATKELKRIFDRFEQGAAGGRKASGTGLGLAIVHQLVELMGGAIQVESELGVGSVFVVELPSRPNLLSASPTALIIDDDPDSRALLATILGDVGIGAVQADSGEDAIDRFSDLRPDAVFVDLRMPGFDGLQTSERLRALGVIGDIPLVMVSASPFDVHSDANAVAKIAAHLPKPVDPGSVLGIVRHLIVEPDLKV